MSMRALASLAIAGMGLTGLAACTPTPNLPTGGYSTSHRDGDGICDAAPVQRFVGVFAQNDLAPIILDESGALQLRWGGPTTIFTTDYREDRVSVVYDREGMIEQITCG